MTISSSAAAHTSAANPRHAPRRPAITSRAPHRKDHNLTLTLYTQPACSQCNMTKKWLDDPERGNLKGQYQIIDLSESPADLAKVKALGYMSAPVVIVGDKHWYGFRPDLLAEVTASMAQDQAA